MNRVIVGTLALAVAWVKAGVLGLILVGLLIAAWYVGHCVMYPFADCLWCSGNPKRRSGSGGSYRKCRHCRGTGERVRVGRRLYDLIARGKH